MSSDRRNRLCNKSASLRCDGELSHSPGPAAANARLDGTVADLVCCVRPLSLRLQVCNTYVKITIKNCRKTSALICMEAWKAYRILGIRKCGPIQGPPYYLRNR